MKNKLKTFLLFIIIFLLNFSIINANEQFNFDITEIEILEKGNKFIGKKRGLITTEDNIKIEADKFEYDKLSNILKLFGNVKIDDINDSSKIFSEKITYYENQEIFISEGNSINRFNLISIQLIPSKLRI